MHFEVDSILLSTSFGSNLTILLARRLEAALNQNKIIRKTFVMSNLFLGDLTRHLILSLNHVNLFDLF